MDNAHNALQAALPRANYNHKMHLLWAIPTMLCLQHCPEAMITTKCRFTINRNSHNALLSQQHFQEAIKATNAFFSRAKLCQQHCVEAKTTTKCTFPINCNSHTRGDSNLAKMTNLIFCYFLGQIQNLLENEVWKNAKVYLIRPH